MSDQSSPAGYNTVTPYLVVRGAAEEVQFMQDVLGASVHELIDAGEGKLRHAELIIGNSMVMLADATEEHAPCSAMLYCYVANCDATYAAALAHGAVSLQAPADQYYGDRTAGFRTQRGVQWWVGTRS